ncbi:MAG TPA: DUF4105 domain-containing protein [Dokdonella sp.]|uniref:lipoprotein N-acyltransferase Lnb domain-containing protein n=1 Tax=Dokdonella sp. TaxID=2291710 RepID=UPI002BA3F5B3|nr:DUF4105 domain-containing protein [Dokdonella sp.]HUD42990.1 DUF4105 domain-containing protein [Dokdonella sp.]
MSRTASARMRATRGTGLLAWLACLLCLWTGTAAAQAADAEPGDSLRISLVTYGPGSLYWERFGHNTLLVRDLASGEATVYNYGLFDFAEDDFFWNFLRGRMTYHVGAWPFDEDLPGYVAEGRSAVEQPLDLTPRQRAELRDFLEWNVRPANAAYRYDYFVSNCSTRLRDALDRVLGGALREQSRGRSRGYTYRMNAVRLLAPDPWLMHVVDLGLGPFADQRLDLWQESFVPMALQRVVGEARVPDGHGGTRPLAAAPVTLAENRIEAPPDIPRDLRWPFLMAGLGIAAALWLLGRARHRRAARIGFSLAALVFSLAAGLAGAVLVLLWGFTEHRAAWRNENLLLLDPLCLALLPTWWRALRADWRPSRTARWLAGLVLAAAGFAVFSKVLPWFVQANVHWIALIVPIHLALAVTLWRQPRPAR